VRLTEEVLVRLLMLIGFGMIVGGIVISSLDEEAGLFAFGLGMLLFWSGLVFGMIERR